RHGEPVFGPRRVSAAAALSAAAPRVDGHVQAHLRLRDARCDGLGANVAAHALCCADSRIPRWTMVRLLVGGPRSADRASRSPPPRVAGSLRLLDRCRLAGL